MTASAQRRRVPVPTGMIMMAVQVDELLAERSIAVDPVTVYRWAQRFTPLLIHTARPCPLFQCC